MKFEKPSLIGLGLLCIGFSIVWYLLAVAVPLDIECEKDEGWHTNTLLNLAENGQLYWDVALASTDYPPLFYLGSYISLKVFKATERVVLAAPNLLFLLLTLIAAYGLAEKHYGPRFAIYPALCVGMYLLTYSVRISPDISVAATLSLFALAASHAMTASSAKALGLLGLTCGLALLSKQTAPLFMAVPTVWMFVELRKSPKKIVGVAIALLTGVLFAYLAFYVRLGIWDSIQNIFRMSTKAPGGLEHGSGLDHLLFYFYELADGFDLIVAAFLGSLILLRKKIKGAVGWLIASAFLPMLILSLFTKKHPEYGLPLATFFFVAVFSGIDKAWGSRRIHPLFAAALLLLCVLPSEGPIRDLTRIRIDFYQNQEKTLDLLADKLDESDDANKFAVFSSGRDQMPFHLANHMTRKGSADRVTLEKPDLDLLPERVVVFQHYAVSPNDNCLAGPDPESWFVNQVHPRSEKDLRFARILAEQYRIESVYPSEGNSDYPPVAICVKKSEIF
jgi:Dolichyl-phosphate-mannose-protein mannosyltransferase